MTHYLNDKASYALPAMYGIRLRETGAWVADKPFLARNAATAALNREQQRLAWPVRLTKAMLEAGRASYEIVKLTLHEEK